MKCVDEVEGCSEKCQEGGGGGGGGGYLFGLKCYFCFFISLFLSVGVPVTLLGFAIAVILSNFINERNRWKTSRTVRVLYQLS